MATPTYGSGGESSLHHQSSGTKDEAKDRAREAAGEAKEKAADLAHQAREQVTDQLDSQKGRATQQLDSISSALRSTSDNLRGEDQDAVARYVGDAAQQVERLSGYLRNHSASELLNEAERYARREPGLFVGGALLLGLVGARFFKSSNPDRGYYGRDYDRGYAPRYGTRFDRDDDVDRGERYSGRYGRGSEGPSYRSDAPGERHYGDRDDDFGRRSSRPGRSDNEPDYEPLHGTAGARMPDTSRTSGTPSTGSSASSTSASSSQSSLGTDAGSASREGRRNA